MGNCLRFCILSLCCLHPSCLIGRTLYCAKCGISIGYYQEYENIPNSCRDHRFVDSQCIDCHCKEEYVTDNCAHRWS